MSPIISPSFQPSNLKTKILNNSLNLKALIDTFYSWKQQPDMNLVSCNDVKSYRNKLGMPCPIHKTLLSCSSFYTIGFSEQEMYELLLNCPQSCGTFKSKSSFSAVQSVMDPTPSPTVDCILPFYWRYGMF